jgi:integrase
VSVKKTAAGTYRATARTHGEREVQRTFRTKREAERWEAKIREDRDRGSWADPSAGRRTTVREYAPVWMERKVWRDSTRQRNEQSFERWIYPTLGDRPLAGLRPGDIDAWIAKVSRDLAPSTVAIVRSPLHSMLNAAVRDGLITANPSIGAALPRPDRHREVVILEPGEVAALAAAMPDRWRVGVLIGVGAGLRIGEALGVTVDRVDFLRRTLRVDRQLLTPFGAGPPHFGLTKTAAAVRTIPVPELLTDAIAAHVTEHGTGADGLILCHPDGSPLRRQRLSGAVAGARDDAGLDGRVSFHVLRHTFASAQIANGVSVKALQVALGHSKPSETLDTYGHLWHDDEDRIRDGASGLMASVLDTAEPADVRNEPRTFRGPSAVPADG